MPIYLIDINMTNIFAKSKTTDLPIDILRDTDMPKDISKDQQVQKTNGYKYANIQICILDTNRYTKRPTNTNMHTNSVTPWFLNIFKGNIYLKVYKNFYVTVQRSIKSSQHLFIVKVWAQFLTQIDQTGPKPVGTEP